MFSYVTYNIVVFSDVSWVDESSLYGLEFAVTINANKIILAGSTFVTFSSSLPTEAHAIVFPLEQCQDNDLRLNWVCTDCANLGDLLLHKDKSVLEV